MGSFNETCALSNLHISSGDKVKVLFLTQNPYVASDGRVAQRGCYHNDNWFLRTPPISGQYYDYGESDFDNKGVISKVVAELFAEDTFERPYGFNQIHSEPVYKNSLIYHYIKAAFQGRLSVEDNYWSKKKDKYMEKIEKLSSLLDYKENPSSSSPVDADSSMKEAFKESPKEISDTPTWKDVHKVLSDNSLDVALIHHSGYNAQQIDYGVVIVHYIDADYSGKCNLEPAKEVLSKYFNVEFADRGVRENVLIVTPKGGIEKLVNPDVLNNIRTPQNPWETNRCLPVLKVMVKEDVWDLYVKNSNADKRSLKAFLKKDSVFERYDALRYFKSLPNQCQPYSHLTYAQDCNYELEEIRQAVFESIMVENVLMRLHKPWYIPPLSGTEEFWDLHKTLNSGIGKIINKKR